MVESPGVRGPVSVSALSTPVGTFTAQLNVPQPTPPETTPLLRFSVRQGPQSGLNADTWIRRDVKVPGPFRGGNRGVRTSPDEGEGLERDEGHGRG